MPIDTEEQKEILLGNKQLLSIFFIVVVLLGVAFTIGYTIGKNTVTVHGPAAAERAPVAQTEPPTPNPGLVEHDTPQAENPVTPAPSHKTPPATHAAKPYVEPAPQTTPAASETPEPAAAGSYLQVAALKREDADRIAAMLRKRGYPATLGDSSKEGLFRVLVGPFKNMADLADSKQKLKASGMDAFIVR